MPVFEVDGSSAPVTAVRFSNGTINQRDLVVSTYKKRQREGKDDLMQQIVTAHVDGSTYVGQNFGPSNRFPTDSCSYYLGLHDRTTGKIRVVPASLIQMEPWFQDKTDDSSLAFSSSTMKEKHDALAKEFGSGRIQRAVNKRIKEKLDDEMIASTSKSMVDSSATLQSPQDVSDLSSQSVAIPPYNADAKTADEVYKLKDIVSPEVLSSLTDASTVLSDATADNIATWRRENKYSTFVLDKLELLSSEPTARKMQVQCLLYLQYLMELYKMRANQLKAKYPLPTEWPQPVRDHMLEMFTLEIKEPGKPFRRCVPPRMKNLMLSHILVICLKMSEFCLELTPLAADLKHAAKKLVSHATFLGCSSKKSRQAQQDVYTVILKVPLTFPTIRDKVVKKRIF